MMEAILEQFFQQISQQKRGVLLLDYDGTLAPFKKRRDQAYISPRIKKLLLQILVETKTKVVIITGRDIGDLLSLLNFEPLPEIWGSHGRERRNSQGKYHALPLSIQQQKGLEIAESVANRFLPKERVEIKKFSRAIHVRGMKGSSQKALIKKIQNEWKPLVEKFHLKISPFFAGLEISVPSKDKGDAVRTIIKKLSKRTPVAYLGDDHTDEDAFQAIRGRGLAILVGARAGKTRAVVKFRKIHDVILFLRRWLKEITYGTK